MQNFWNACHRIVSITSGLVSLESVRSSWCLSEIWKIGKIMRFRTPRQAGGFVPSQELCQRLSSAGFMCYLFSLRVQEPLDDDFCCIKSLLKMCLLREIFEVVMPLWIIYDTSKVCGCRCGRLLVLRRQLRGGWVAEEWYLFISEFRTSAFRIFLWLVLSLNFRNAW